eukprot:TRINITY_DN7461_c0_g1_i1.p1 TRINITY_DN7461_c0_g1~~TRINITY_DN7461_c0_g1_i1.p1  ORF type:complete len:741 (-),score=307.31 TRINITY_DN7461_c0_g1_i1:157-2379(-)
MDLFWGLSIASGEENTFVCPADHTLHVGQAALVASSAAAASGAVAKLYCVHGGAKFVLCVLAPGREQFRIWTTFANSVTFGLEAPAGYEVHLTGNLSHVHDHGPQLSSDADVADSDADSDANSDADVESEEAADESAPPKASKPVAKRSSGPIGAAELQPEQRNKRAKTVAAAPAVPATAASNAAPFSELKCDQFTSLPKKTGHQIADELGLDSAVKARKFFQWLIAPVSVDEFYDEYWEKKPLIIHRRREDYFKGWLSKGDMDQMLRKHTLRYGQNLNITKYEHGQRSTLDPPDSVATADDVWRHFEEGCSVRLLHPQQYSDPLWKLLSVLEEFWGCQAGVNSYLTPKGSQGFAPHYDDVEVFVLQTEGAKRWRLYLPADDAAKLPRYSSKNFDQAEIGSPVVDFVMEAGDFMYFPRGTIHQAVSVPDKHSLHVTVSTGLKNSWFDFLEKAVPQALQIAFEESIELRESLPRSYFDYTGIVHADAPSDAEDADADAKPPPARDEFKDRCAALVDRLAASLPVDAVADRMAVAFVQSRLPPHPCLSAMADMPGLVRPNPPASAKSGGKSEAKGKAAKVVKPKVTQHTMVRLATRHAARLVIEADTACLYSPMQNKREAHATKESQVLDKEEADSLCLEYDLDFAPSIEVLINSYPDFVPVTMLGIDDAELSDVITTLWEQGIVFLREPPQAASPAGPGSASKHQRENLFGTPAPKLLTPRQDTKHQQRRPTPKQSASKRR